MPTCAAQEFNRGDALKIKPLFLKRLPSALVRHLSRDETLHPGARKRGPGRRVPGRRGSPGRGEGRAAMRSSRSPASRKPAGQASTRTPGGRAEGSGHVETGKLSAEPRDRSTAGRDSPSAPPPDPPGLLTVLQELPDGRCRRPRTQSSVPSPSAAAAVLAFHVVRSRGDDVSGDLPVPR